MPSAEATVHIDTTSAEAWGLIADLRGVIRWHPKVCAVTADESRARLGARRHCRLRGGGSIQEQVCHLVEGRELWVSMSERGAIKSAELGLILRPGTDEPNRTDGPDGITVVAIADYHLALGPLGPVVDRLTVRRLMHRHLEELLAGLKQHLERPGTSHQPAIRAGGESDRGREFTDGGDVGQTGC